MRQDEDTLRRPLRHSSHVHHHQQHIQHCCALEQELLAGRACLLVRLTLPFCMPSPSSLATYMISQLSSACLHHSLPNPPRKLHAAGVEGVAAMRTLSLNRMLSLIPSSPRMGHAGYKDSGDYASTPKPRPKSNLAREVMEKQGSLARTFRCGVAVCMYVICV